MPSRNRSEVLAAERERLSAEINALAELEEPTEADVERSEALYSLWTNADEAYRTQVAHEERVERARSIGMNPRSHDGGRSGYAPELPGGGRDNLDGYAKRSVDAAFRSGLLPEHAAERAVALFSSGSRMDRNLAARWAVATGDPAYLRAFVSLLGDPQRGHMLWSEQESNAYKRAEIVRMDMRAMSLTDSAGGVLVPLTLDPTVLLTSGGSINPLRRISRVVQTATDQWKGVSSAGVTAEWLAEANEAADATPTLAGPEIPVHKGSAWVPYSFEVGMDGVGFARELQKLLLDAADQLMATAYTIGDGIGKPKGIVTALAGTASEINGTGTEAIVAADAVALQNALPPRFSARAQWAGHLATINALRQLESGNGAAKFPEMANGQLLGRPINENSNMDGVITPAATANNYALIYGDFSQFVIVDRIGTTIELNPMLMGDNGRPTGERGLFMWFRTGSDVVVPNAFRMLDVPTTA